MPTANIYSFKKNIFSMFSKMSFQSFHFSGWHFIQSDVPTAKPFFFLSKKTLTIFFFGFPSKLKVCRTTYRRCMQPLNRLPYMSEWTIQFCVTYLRPLGLVNVPPCVAKPHGDGVACIVCCATDFFLIKRAHSQRFSFLSETHFILFTKTFILIFIL
mgnify:CR=1 FL=1